MIFQDTKIANSTLMLREGVQGPEQTILTRWIPTEIEAEDDVFVLTMGPDNLGAEGIKKFFRGLQIFGTGIGHIIAFMDGVQVKEGDIDLGDLPTHPNLFWLPRGTNGFEIEVILSLAGHLESIKVMADGTDNLETK